MDDLYWIGIRQSDILSIESFYAGSITFFGDGQNNNISLFLDKQRTNHNINSKDFQDFYNKSIRHILLENPSAKFMLYNPQIYLSLDADLKNYIICINDTNILNILNNKILCKLWIKDCIKLLPTIQVFGNEISTENLSKLFPRVTQFIIQPQYSSGGHGTYLLNSKTELAIIKQLSATQLYLVSSYCHNSIPINIHCIIYEEYIQLYPISIQIIKTEDNNLIYQGGDFAAANLIDKTINQSIEHYSYRICKKLQSVGYRGVCGIDFIIVEDDVYFMEINPRFQASTAVLNYALKEYCLPSINEANYQAFNMKQPSCILEDNIKINYSFFSYSAKKGSEDFINNMFTKYFTLHPYMKILSDGYLPNVSAQNGAYLFRLIFNHNIISIFDDQLRSMELITGYDMIEPRTKIQIKTMLINFGVYIPRPTLEVVLQKGGIREANFSAIDIVIWDKIVVNCPYRINQSIYSPFIIKVFNKELALFYFNSFISYVDIYHEIKLNNKITMNGVKYSSVAFLAIDRLRINYNHICYFKKTNKSCLFCNLPSKNQNYNLNDIKEIVNDYLENENFRHILIGGGSSKPDSNFQDILRLTHYLHSQTTKPLYLMSIPPKDTVVLKKLYNAGVSEVAFNIEIFDEKYASKYMPGKSCIPRKYYFEVLKEAVELWGNNGNVRSMVILGLEPEDSFLKGIENLCKIGVQPMISIFRPMPNTPLSNLCPLPINAQLRIYNEAKKICKKYNLQLGPSCIACQNNTMSFPE